MTQERTIGKRLRTKLLIWGSIAAASGAVVSVLTFFILYMVFTPSSVEDADVWERNRVFGFTFLDADGELMSRRGAFHGEILQLDDLPPYLPAAFLATEDRRYYEHGGIDPQSLARAFVVNFRAGRTVQGGSTITQQLAKNLFLTNDRTYSRKIKELFLALWLERHLTKDEILTLYLNRIYMGASTYGIDAAAQFYFGKSARDVTIAEAAMLAGLPKAPSKLAPTNNLDSAQQRAAIVLDNLVKNGHLTQGEVYAARANPAEPTKRENTDGQNYFIDYVTNEAHLLIGQTTSNIIIQTSLDPKLQRQAEQAVEERMSQNAEELGAEQAAAITMSPNGAVRAMVGGRDYFESQFNRAVQAERQPGSAFKPFVYLAALEMGEDLDSVWEDSPITIGKWSPSNYGNSYSGRVTMRKAFEDSINTVAVKISQKVEPENVVERAQRLGIESPLAAHPSIALGTAEVNLLELTSAYSTFANNGLSHPTYSILSIQTEDGVVLYEHQEQEAERVIDEDTAEAMTHLMYQVIYRGTGQAASLGDRPAAGKTGTSQEWRDAWFVGYTSDYVTGVWVGNDDATPTNRVVGGRLPAQIWRQIMTAAHADLQVVELPGAYPARDTHKMDEFVTFMNDLSRQFRRVDARSRRWTRDADDSPPKKKRKVFPWD